MTLYAILGIPQDADDDAIRLAYRALARRYHPDMGAGSCSDKFREIAQAYETLIDHGRRQSYDQSLACTIPVHRVTAEPLAPNVEPLSGYRAAPPIDDLLFELLRFLRPRPWRW
jgi:curved DNA-binding protein CbpA